MLTQSLSCHSVPATGPRLHCVQGYEGERNSKSSYKTTMKSLDSNMNKKKKKKKAAAVEEGPGSL